jgi:hypothetical protein
MCQTRCRAYTYDIERTYDVARTMLYVYILYIARTTSYVRYTMRCCVSHIWEFAPEDILGYDRICKDM